MKFRVPLATLGDALKGMGDFPFPEPGSVQYPGPTLFVRGTKSRYISDDTFPAIKAFFPDSRVADVEAGHWLISENPEAFRQSEYLPLTYLFFTLPRYNLTVVGSGCGVFARNGIEWTREYA